MGFQGKGINKLIQTQTMGEKGCCSSIGNIEEHEQFKRLSKAARIKKLQEVYDKYGVMSPEFFVQVKPFIMWTVYQSLRGMHYSNLEDLVNNAFQGGKTTHYNKPVDKKPEYGTEKYYRKYKNIGSFVMYVVSSSVSKYRNKNFRNQIVHEDTSQDISDRLNFTDFELNNDLEYYITEPEDEPLFPDFKFNDNLKRHIEMIKETRPRNNVIYNYILWRSH